MANYLSGNPLILDGSSLSVVLISTWMKVEHFEWADYAAITDQVQLADRNGHAIWNATATSDKQEVRSAKVGWINGLQELTHSSGTVLVYLA